LVCLGLADDHLREHSPIVADQRRSAIIAATFKTENNRHFVPGPLPHPPKMH
jgi:hypothetical protein